MLELSERMGLTLDELGDRMSGPEFELRKQLAIIEQGERLHARKVAQAAQEAAPKRRR